jgi:hypothetical protein
LGGLIGGAAFPYTGSAIISGSIQLTGSYYQQLQDNEDWTTEYIPTANATTPNFIFAKQGAYDSTGVNNILMGIASSATGASVNRFIGFNGSNNHSNAIIAGYNNFISGSAGSRSSNVILGGNNNAFFRNDLAVSALNNVILGGSSHDIEGGSFNAILAGNNSSLTTGSLDTSPSYNAFLGGQNHDIIGGDANAIVAGVNNEIGGAKQSVIVGGENNIISQSAAYNDFDSVIVGGRNNNITDHARSVILGGDGLSTTKANEVVVPHLTISGSVTAGVYAITPASSTGSMDCSTGNFFTMTLDNGTDVRLEASNLTAGQTINLKLTNNATAAGTISFDTGVFKFEGGTPFTATATTNAVDVMTFISFDGTSLQTTGLKNFS